MKKQGLLLLCALFALVGCGGNGGQSVQPSASTPASISYEPMLDTLSLKDTTHRKSFSDTKMEFVGDGGFEFTVDKDGATTACVDKVSPVRCYKNTKLTFKHAAPIKKMIFDCQYFAATTSSQENDYAVGLQKGTWSLGSAKQTADKKTEVIWTSEEGASEITVKLSFAQVRIYSIEVYSVI